MTPVPVTVGVFAFPKVPAGCRWKAKDEMSDGTNTLKQLIAFYEANGRMPFPIQGGDGTEGGEEGKGSEGGKENAGTEDVAGLKSALEKERDARRTADKTAKDLAKELETIRNSGKSESEKLAARLEVLEKDNQAKGAAIRERDAKDATRDAAKKAGAPDGDLIYRVLKGDIEYDDDGKPTNLKDLIADLKQTTPHLFKPATTRVDGGAGNGSKPGKDDMNTAIRLAAGRG